MTVCCSRNFCKGEICIGKDYALLPPTYCCVCRSERDCRKPTCGEITSFDVNDPLKFTFSPLLTRAYKFVIYQWDESTKTWKKITDWTENLEVGDCYYSGYTAGDYGKGTFKLSAQYWSGEDWIVESEKMYSVSGCISGKYITVTVAVADTIGNPIEKATVCIKEKGAGSWENCTNTSPTGKVSFAYKKSCTTYTIEASKSGYTTVTKDVLLPDEDYTVNITLKKIVVPEITLNVFPGIASADFKQILDGELKNFATLPSKVDFYRCKGTTCDGSETKIGSCSVFADGTFTCQMYIKKDGSKDWHRIYAKADNTKSNEVAFRNTDPPAVWEKGCGFTYGVSKGSLEGLLYDMAGFTDLFILMWGCDPYTGKKTTTSARVESAIWTILAFVPIEKIAGCMGKIAKTKIFDVVKETGLGNVLRLDGLALHDSISAFEHTKTTWREWFKRLKELLHTDVSDVGVQRLAKGIQGNINFKGRIVSGSEFFIEAIQGLAENDRRYIVSLFENIANDVKRASDVRTDAGIIANTLRAATSIAFEDVEKRFTNKDVRQTFGEMIGKAVERIREGKWKNVLTNKDSIKRTASLLASALLSINKKVRPFLPYVMAIASVIGVTLGILGICSMPAWFPSDNVETSYEFLIRDAIENKDWDSAQELLDELKNVMNNVDESLLIKICKHLPETPGALILNWAEHTRNSVIPYLQKRIDSKDAANIPVYYGGEFVKFKVDKVIDGDTIKIVRPVRYSDHPDIIRMLGINAPEIKHYSEPGECYGSESKKNLESYIKSKSGMYIWCWFDSYNWYDAYNRILAVVYTVNPSNETDYKDINLQQLKDGMACYYYPKETYGENRRMEELKDVYLEAAACAGELEILRKKWTMKRCSEFTGTCPTAINTKGVWKECPSLWVSAFYVIKEKNGLSGDVYVDGVYVGKTGDTIAIKKGDHIIEVKKDGYIQLKGFKLSVGDGDISVCTITSPCTHKVELHKFLPKLTSGDISFTKYEDKLTITWSTVSGADGYYIYLKGPSDIDFNYIGKTSLTNYSIMNLTCDTTYEVGITSYEKVTHELFGEIVIESEMGTDMAKTNKCTVTPPSEKSYLWITSIPTGASVYIDGKNTGQTTPLKNYEISEGTYEITLKKDGYNDYSWIQVVEENEIYTKTITLIPTTFNIVVSKCKDDTVSITWQKVPEISGYEIYKNGSLVDYVGSGTKKYTFYYLDDYTDYTFQVKAYNASGVVSVSNVVCITAKSCTKGITKIEVSTNLSSASFTITGKNTGTKYEGSGASYSVEAVPDTYTITYGDVIGYTKPSSETKTLTSCQTITFTGTYTKIKEYGNIEVKCNISSASWTLSGPENTTLKGSGTYKKYTNQLTGDWTISYGDVAGYVTPPGETKTLTKGKTITFTGTYVETGTGTLNIKSTPTSAYVFIDYSYVGNTPISNHTIDTGVHEVILIKENYKVYSVKITIKKDTVHNLNITLDAADNMQLIGTIKVEKGVYELCDFVDDIGKGNISGELNVLLCCNSVYLNDISSARTYLSLIPSNIRPSNIPNSVSMIQLLGIYAYYLGDISSGDTYTGC